MKIGLIGLGKIGNAVAQRLINANHTVVGFDLDKTACNQAKDLGVVVVENIEMMARQARIIWLFLPAGPSIDQALRELVPHMAPGDIIIDGGNSNYTDSIKIGPVCSRLLIYSLLIAGHREDCKAEAMDFV